jgi:superfamily II DNA/RNA helicase
VFDFPVLQQVCAGWTNAQIPQDPAETSLLERIRQILLAIRDGDEGLTSDLVPLVRQAILLRKYLRQDATLLVPLAPGWPSREEWEQAGCAPWVNNKMAHLDAQLPRLAWLGAQADLFDDACHELRSRPDYRVPMDPFMARATGLDAYLSRGQREALRAMFQLPPGVTLIANLPTGSGKSLLGQAAALVQSGLGKMTIVVVPTVALALDQMRRMKEMLRALDPHWEDMPLAYHGGLSQEERRQVRQALADGTQRILFTSPESVTGSLRRPIESAARAGFVTTVVIDEAHLVVGWGDAFRPAFQLLPALVRTLRELNSGEPIRTVLASATLTSNTVRVLQNLFGPPEQTYMVAGVHLRPEPRYATYNAVDAVERTELVLEAVDSAPRPFILYVTERAQAKVWHRRLEARGHRRIALFHGGTGDRERERILEDWAANRVDAVVATSAFGLGVDKSDVRAVIHATLPESLDRFYQEVGRGGRDGKACASLLVSEPQDIPLARGIASPTLIGNDNGHERWTLMLRDAKQDASGLTWVDITVRPAHLKQKSRANKAWNLRTLTLMARAKLIELHAVDAGEAQVDGVVAVDNLTRAAVRIIHPGHRDPAVFNEVLDRARAETFGSSELGVDLMVDVADGRHEMSSVLERIYALHLPGATLGVETCCGGCTHDWGQRAPGTGYRDPAVRRLPRMGSADISAWRRRWNMEGDTNTLLVAFSPEQFGKSAPSKLVSLLLDALPVHTLLLAERCPATLQEAVRRQLQERWESAVCLDRYAGKPDDEIYGAAGEVRIIVADSAAALPQELWLSECALQVVLVPSDLPDPDPRRPLRRLLDTRRYINHEDFVSRLIG